MRRFIAWKQAVINRLIHKPWIVGVRQTPSEPAFNPADMFTPTTPGWVYDLSDFSTLFQDSLGTTPVTAVEQPVGLVLDKSQGLVLGPELVTNGDFTTTVNGWAAVAGSTIEWDNGALKTVTTNINQGATQTISTVAGRSYKISGTAVSGSSFRIFFGGQAQQFSAGPWSFVATATGATTELRLSNSEMARTLVYDNISVKLLPGNHASQPTTTKMPVLSSRVNLLTYSEDFTNAAWAKITTDDVVTSNAALSPIGTMTADKHVPSTTSGPHTLRQNVAGGFTTIWAKPAGYNYFRVMWGGVGVQTMVFDLVAGTVTLNNLGATATITLVGDGWAKIEIQFGGDFRGGACAAPNATSSFIGDGVSGIYIWGAQFNYGTTAQPYQRITTATNYDTVGFPLYLKGDGIDDFMSTADIDFTGADSVTTWTGVQKLQDATALQVWELGADTNTVDGTFSLNAPQTDGATGYQFTSRGTVRAVAQVTGYPAPNKAVITTIGRISTDTCSLQVNEDAAATNGAEQGINAYTSQPAYFLSRAGTSRFFNGQLYSNVCLGRVATLQELDDTRDWVNDRTGAY